MQFENVDQQIDQKQRRWVAGGLHEGKIRYYFMDLLEIHEICLV